MRYYSTRTTITALLLFFTVSWLNMSMANQESDWSGEKLNFKIFLDAKEIGYQRVIIRPTSDGELVSVDTRFDIKVFFINAFSYRHTAEETWKDKCLTSINTQTTENGDQMFVRAESGGEGLTITNQDTETTLAGCISSFAYWDHKRLDRARLLNAQTGEHVPAKLSFLGEVLYENEGNSIAAKHYLLEAENAQINIWYSTNNEWLALKTKVKGGRILAYHKIIETADAEGL